MDYYSLVTSNLKEHNGFVFNCYRKIIQKRSPPQLKHFELQHICDDVICELFKENKQMRMKRLMFQRIASQMAEVFPGEKESDFYRVVGPGAGPLYRSYTKFRRLAKAAGYYAQNPVVEKAATGESDQEEADASEGDTKETNDGEEAAGATDDDEADAEEANGVEVDKSEGPITLPSMEQNFMFGIAKKILILAKRRKVEALEVYLPLLKDSKIENEALPGYNKEHMIAVALLVLPHLFPCRQFRVPKHTSKRIPVSRYEVQQIFLAHYKSIEEYDSAFKTFLLDTQDTPNSTVQPRMAIVGELNAENYIIQVSGTRYCMPTFLESFGALFKMYCAQSFKYPADVRLPWLFCQQIFFGTYTDNDTSPVDFLDVISEITLKINSSHVSHFDKTFDASNFLELSVD